MPDTNEVNLLMGRRGVLGALAGASVVTLLGAGATQAKAAEAAKAGASYTGTIQTGTTLEDFASPADFKVMWLIKRNPALTVEEFRAAYLEHAHEIVDAMGKHLVFYRLNFLDEQHHSMVSSKAGETAAYTGPRVRLDYDCITEMGATGDWLPKALTDEHVTSLAEYESQLKELKFVDYASVISLYGREYIFVKP